MSRREIIDQAISSADELIKARPEMVYHRKIEELESLVESLIDIDGENEDSYSEIRRLIECYEFDDVMAILKLIRDEWEVKE